MTDKPSQTAELVHQLEQGTTELKQLEAILQRLMQVLTESGFQISVDLVGLTHAQAERMDKARRQAIFDELHRRLLADVPLIALFNPVELAAVRANVEGYKGWPQAMQRFWGVSLK